LDMGAGSSRYFHGSSSSGSPIFDYTQRHRNGDLKSARVMEFGYRFGTYSHDWWRSAST